MAFRKKAGHCPAFFLAESVGAKIVRDLDPNQIGIATVSCMARTTCNFQRIEP
jgi:hypothetical protein